MFAAFPDWYATLFSAYYLPLFVVLVALILRGTASVFRDERPGSRWRTHWDRLMVGRLPGRPAAHRRGAGRVARRPAARQRPRVHRGLPRPRAGLRPVHGPGAGGAVPVPGPALRAPEARRAGRRARRAHRGVGVGAAAGRAAGRLHGLDSGRGPRLRGDPGRRRVAGAHLRGGRRVAGRPPRPAGLGLHLQLARRSPFTLVGFFGELHPDLVVSSTSARPTRSPPPTARRRTR